MRVFWFTLFVLFLAYKVSLEQLFIFQYYTYWTLTFEIVLFALWLTPEWSDTASAFFPIVFAPSLLVAIGFWVLIAPLEERTFEGLLEALVPHGLNAVAMCIEMRPMSRSDVWKPVLYTLIYNVFLYMYVTLGGRSVSGKLPYWYAQYDSYLGWLFAILAMSSVALIHLSFAMAYPVPPESSKQCIV
tara:strand:- start:1059 stop:1619 length:561 start_codon:yes stop_codon:yes gene_type:complete